MKKAKGILWGLMVIGLIACQSFQADSTSAAGTYSYHVGGYDWGVGVDKVLLSLDSRIGGISADDLKVTEIKQATDWTDSAFPVNVVEVERKITGAYLCDSRGNPVKGSSRYAAVELYVSPSEGSPFLYSMHTSRNTWSDPYRLTFSLTGNSVLESLSIAPEATGFTTAADMFDRAAYTTTSGEVYHYAVYKPAKKTDTLFVWLHGGGEGEAEGSDAYVPVLANKVTALAGDEFQKALGGAVVLAPQSPTFWMNGGNGDYTEDNSTIYTESLHELIDYYKGECGAEQVVLAGCSNGGFMTLDLMMNYPGEYVCGIPICEGKLDKNVTDEEIGILKDQPLFFIYSESDPTLPPADYAIPTIKRLRAVGARELKVFSPEKVVDTSGLYTDDKGNPYQYSGHWSWIYFDNNEARDDVTGQDVWSWIGDQLK